MLKVIDMEHKFKNKLDPIGGCEPGCMACKFEKDFKAYMETVKHHPDVTPEEKSRFRIGAKFGFRNQWKKRQILESIVAYGYDAENPGTFEKKVDEYRKLYV